MDKLKVAVISCGMIANKGHLPAYQYYKERCEVTAMHLRYRSVSVDWNTNSGSASLPMRARIKKPAK